MDKLEVKRIEVYEILTDGKYPKGIFTIGTFRAGYALDELANVVTDGTLISHLPMQIGEEVRHVMTAIVKEIHNPNLAAT